MKYYKISVENKNPVHVVIGSRSNNFFSYEEPPRIYDFIFTVSEEEWARKPNHVTEKDYLSILAIQNGLFKQTEDACFVTKCQPVTELEYLKTTLPPFLSEEEVLEHWQKYGKEKTMKLPITEIGKLSLQFQEDIAAQYKYKKLPGEVENSTLMKYLRELPEGFDVNSNTLQNTSLPGYEIIPQETFPIYSREGTPIANKYDRIVVGHYGAFVEIADADMIKDNVKVKKGQEYRINDEKFASRVKYQWFTTADTTNCKLYYQQKGVVYADYKPGFWYVSPFEVLDKNELKMFHLESEKECKTLEEAEEIEKELE